MTLFSCLFWYLRSEVANLCNLRVWPSVNLRLLPLSLLWALNKNVLTYFPKRNPFQLLGPKMVYREKFEGKLFSDPKCSGPLLQTLPLNDAKQLSNVGEKRKKCLHNILFQFSTLVKRLSFLNFPDLVHLKKLYCDLQ